MATSLFQNRFKVWLEIDSAAIKHNIDFFRSQLALRPGSGLPPKLWAVVKSNAYGHGLDTFTRLADHYGVDGFCVDSVIEGRALRNLGIKKPILILGPTLSPDFHELAKYWDISETISNFEALRDPAFLKFRPPFHLKIETGMHRQGFNLDDLQQVIKEIQDSRFKIYESLRGVYSHFAAANPEHRDFTEQQFKKFQEAVSIIKSQLSNVALTAHISATGGTLLDKKYHLDAVRIGLGLYGYSPFVLNPMPTGRQAKPYTLTPVLKWCSIISEIKNVPSGESIGYDLTEKLTRPTKVAIMPIGYWHGLPRALSSVGYVDVNGQMSKVLGRICMDITMVDVTDIPCQTGDLIKIEPLAVAQKTDSSIYEIITRINPLIHRRVI